MVAEQLVPEIWRETIYSKKEEDEFCQECATDTG